MTLLPALQVEDRLHQSEERYRVIFEDPSLANVYFDSEGRLTLINAKAAQIIGKPMKDIFGKHTKHVYPAQSNDMYWERVRHAVEIGGTAEYTDFIESTEEWFLTRIVPVYGASGTIMGAQASTRDITESKRAEEALRQSEEKLSFIFESIADGVNVTDMNGRIVALNEAKARMHGYDNKEELLGQNIFKLISDKDLARAKDHRMKTLDEGYNGSIEYTYLTRDGREFAGEANVAVLKDSSGKTVGVVTVSKDITERKRAEEELRASEEKYHNLVESSPVGIVVVTLGGRVIEANKAVVEMHGYDSKEEFMKINVTERYYDLAERERFLSLIAKGPVKDLEVRRKRYDGTSFWASLTSIPQATKSGEQVLITIVQDITERKKMEEKLQQSEEKLRMMFESMADGVSVTDMDGKIVETNEAKARMHGYDSKEELLGQDVYDLVANREHAGLKEHRAKAMNEGLGGTVECTFLMKDGKEFPAEASVSIFKTISGKPAGVITISKDITERKQAEDKLHQREENFRRSLDDLPLGIRIVTSDGEYLYANQAMLDIFGYSSLEELKAIPEAKQYTPEGYSLLLRRRESRKLGQPLPNEYEVSIVRKDGGIRYLSAFRKEVIWDGEKQWQIIYQDITERKRAEEREKLIRQELIVSSRLATVGEMAAGIAHEINNPLTGVVGFSDLLLKKELPEDIRKDVGIIYEGAQRIANIIDRMLRFARQTKPETKQVNINDIIETTLAMRASEMKTSNINVTTELAPGLPLTSADAGLLQQAFLNIILNAEMAMKLAHNKGSLKIKTERINNTVRATFEDDGPGISRENIDKVFDPFFTTRDPDKGTGLGLSICHSIIMQHTGKIYARSTPGKGATFIVELPIVDHGEQLALDEPAVAGTKSTSKARILVVDDDPIVQEFLTAVLTEEGHKVDIVDNGDDAMERLGSEEYDVILLDVKLPGISGIDIYEELDKSSKSLVSKVIFITGDMMSVDTMVFIKSAQAPYLTKPFDAEQLTKEIGRILSLRS
ncbi:PAS domain S-box protein [Chloroflexota bacterium]